MIPRGAPATLGLVALLVAVAGRPLDAYLKLGVRLDDGRSVSLKWNAFPVRYFITDRSVPDVDVDQFRSAVADAFDTWRQVATADVGFEFVGYTSAEPLYIEAVEISLQTFGKFHPNYAAGLNNLGWLYIQMKNYPEAEARLLEAKKIHVNRLGEDSNSYAQVLNNLGWLYEELDNHDEAERNNLKAMEIRRKVLGEDHPSYATSLHNLAVFYRNHGKFEKAEPLFRRSNEIRRKSLGTHHHLVAGGLINLAVLYAAKGRYVDALKLLNDAAEIHDRLIGRIFSISSESQRMKYIGKIRQHMHMFMSLVMTHFMDSPTAVRAAFDLVQRRKALGAEAMAVQRDAVLSGKYPDLKDKFEEYSALRMQIAQRTLEGAGSEDAISFDRLIKDWTDRKNSIETELARQIPDMDLEEKLHEAECSIVASALPPDSALVEFVCFKLRDFSLVHSKEDKIPSASRYAAFIVLSGQPDKTILLDLGDADEIDTLIYDFKASVFDKNPTRDPGLELRERVLDKVLQSAGDCGRIFMAPDGNLSLIPFEILPLDKRHRIIDDYRISYLSVGRDILRFERDASKPYSNPLVAADPDFDLGVSSEYSERGSSRRFFDRLSESDKAKLDFRRLTGTRPEGEGRQRQKRQSAIPGGRQPPQRHGEQEDQEQPDPVHRKRHADVCQ